MIFRYLLDRSQRTHRFSVLLLALCAVVFSGAVASAEEACFPAKGYYEEQAVFGPECQSTAGLCIAGEYRGVIQGDFFGTATSLTPTADTPTTSVVTFTSDSVIHARVRGRQGDLMIKNAGVFQSVGDGHIVDLQIITGGTGELAGASGAIRASGLFDPATGMGASEYDGLICLP